VKQEACYERRSLPQKVNAVKHLSIIQHTEPEWLGHIEDHLEGRGIRFGYHRPFAAGGTLPDIRTIGAGLLLVGGGRWGAASLDALWPSLDAEVRLARACLMLGTPVVGFGLGAQILSLAADGAVTAAPLALRVGEQTRALPGALGGLLPATFPAVVYMRDRPVPPAYAQVLAVDAGGLPAVFQIGANAFGFTGHPGIRRAMVEELIMSDDDAPADAAESLDAISALGSQIEDALVPIMAGLVVACGWV
jgi:GMP synthase-like glutamine amidotransferase